jgi:hypothetical protein
MKPPRRERRLLAALTLVAAAPLPAAPPPAAALRLTDATAESGINFTATSGRMPSREILEVNGGGVALFDYDGDGDLDLFLANGATLNDTERGPGSRLFANDGCGRFTDVTRETGIDLRRWAMGVAVGDHDADGDPDLYVTCFGPNVLLRNDRTAEGRRFTDVSAQAGVGDPRWGTSAAFGDVDGDGDLDLYVANYLVFDVAAPPARKLFKGAPVFGGPVGLEAPHDVFYENRGDGTFRDATRDAGLVVPRPGYGMVVTILDLDRDGHQDIFVGNDSTENFLFRNLGGGKFREVGVASGLATNYDGRAQATMGVAVGDVDGNGQPDLFTTNFSSDTNTLHLNLGRGLFDDRTSQFGLAAVSRPFLSWGAGFYDFDADGDEDLFVASGHIYPEARTHDIDSEYEQPALLFERRGTRFERTLEAGTMLRTPMLGRSTAFGDLDDDGDVDVVLTTLNGPVRLFRNDAPWRDVVVVELQGRGGNRYGHGSVVELVEGDRVQRRWIHGGSYQSADSPAAHFGFAATPIGPLALRVHWVNGDTVVYEGVPANRKIRLLEGRATVEAVPLAGRAP